MAFITEEEAANEIARKSRNYNEGAHPYDLPDAKAVESMAGSETTGMDTADWGKSDEEIDELKEQGNIAELKSRNMPLANSGNRSRKSSSKSVSPENQKYNVLGRGGGLGANDLRSEYGRSVDPELRLLGPNSDVKRKLKIKGNKEWAKQLELDRVGYDSPLYDKFADLSTIWSDKNTKVVYKVGEYPDQDQIVFRNERLKWRNKTDSGERTLSVTELKDALDKSGINLRIERPKSEFDKRFMTDLRHFKLGSGVIKSENTSVEISEKTVVKVEPKDGAYNIKLNIKALEKYGASEKEKGLVNSIVDRWKHSDVGWFGFEINNENPALKVVKNIILVTKNGERFAVSAHLARSVIEGISVYKKTGTDVPSGFIFAGEGDFNMRTIHPDLSLESAKVIMKKIKLDGKSLPEDTTFFFG